MNKLCSFGLLFLFLMLFACQKTTSNKKPLDTSLVLWYNNPANDWTEALPVGNGRLGAMVYGNTSDELIQFNEETLWTGQPHDYAHEGASKYFAKLRELLWAGKQDEAEELGNAEFMSQPLGQLNYQPFGNILLSFPNHENSSNYTRKLNLEDAITSVSYTVNEVAYKREIFASNPDQAIIVHLEASESEALEFSVGLNSPHSDFEISTEDNTVVLKGKANNYPKEKIRAGGNYPESKIRFEACLKIVAEGAQITQENNKLKVENASNATLILVGATNFVNYQDISADPSERCNNYLKALDRKSYNTLKEAHLADYKNLFSRVHIDLGSGELSNRPTNERLATFSEDNDPSLVALLFQYGRYLLISSSREGTQPANLQGIWNAELAPSWDSKYTININTEMNYWPAEITNLSELADPVMKLTEELALTGKSIAKEHYNLNGWVAHHNTDIWRGAAPINNANHGIWPTGGAWLCQNLWWHYQFSGDKDFLATRAYPVLKSASEFFVDYLVPDPGNPEWLVSGPSNSPENGGLVMAPTMDHQIIRNLFSNTIEAAELLAVDKDFVEKLKEKRAKIAPNQIGQYGQLQEWLVDIDDPKNEHRHVSHLWGLHPGNEIHPLTTPELAEACKVTLSHRGDEGTGWSRAWKINFWARLLDGDHAFIILKNLILPARTPKLNKDRGGLYNNLFDAHPPFQIDGNFGATSGIAEMLVQSHLRDASGDFYLDILPALPNALPNGTISGLKGRGGFEISLVWKEGQLLKVEVRSLLGNKLNLRYQGKLISQATEANTTYSFSATDF
ncbi:glycoside hydrolase family 95 protein [uncultured Draconibacterium sp.]|uniref:glycoside hydrolase family 95 protein n=1 Tax=uncultured Draconibacterium sp. TaxID=1573823 RepID=UPI0025E78F48|nr:glycoside hydrolase family 95 protein [uncultured Draconibacterium sp.]